jgi:hypothetical protein
MGKTTGRRSGELFCLAATSWTLKFFDCSDGKRRLRKMHCITCFKNGDGVGQYPICFIETKEECTEVNLVVITLLLIERKKMIKSTIAVYDGHEWLVIDPNVFEMAQELESKLNAATDTMKGDHLNKLLCGKEEDLSEAIVSYVRELDKKDDKIPFYTVCRNGFQTSEHFHPASSTIADFGRFAGWTPTPKFRFGGTCARKGARQDSKNLVASKTNKELHLTHQLGHGSNVAIRHYENARDYNDVMPSNLLQASTNVEMLEEMVESVTVRPSYENREFFDQTRPKLLQSLKPARQFLEAYARDPESKAEATFVCFGVGCGKSFMYYADWR